MTPTIRLLSVSFVVACLLAASVAIADAADPGTSDPTATQSLGVHDEETNIGSLAARPDGGLLAVQGKQIKSFGAGGAVGPEFAPGLEPGEASLIPVAGGKTLVLSYLKLTRLDPDGSIDKSFGVGGTVKTGGGAKAAIELGSGKIALVGTYVEGAKSVAAYLSVELLKQDGSEIKGGGFSATLSNAGVAVGGSIGVPEISATADGGGLVVGGTFLLELDADGSVNRGFGKGGVVEGVFGPVAGHVFPNGSVETVGSGYGSRSTDIALHRYTPAGQPDTGFGPEGTHQVDLGAGEEGVNVASWGADGSVIVGGSAVARGPCPEKECEETPFVAAFDPAGGLEAGFGEGGVLRLAALAGLPDGGTSPGVTAMTRPPDGSIVAGGSAPPKQTTGFLAAFSPRGALLSGFGEGGVVRTPAERPAELTLAGIVPQPDGGVLGLGTTDLGIGDAPVLVRFTPGNRLDPSLGAGAGYVILRKDLGFAPHGATGFAIDGNELLTGVYDYPISHLLMAHADDGSPVGSFGSGGIVDLPKEVRTQALAFAADGDPVVLGHQSVAGPFSSEPGVIMRLAPDGSADPGFRGGGSFRMHLGRQAVRGKALLTGPGGRIVAGGSLGHRFAIVSLLPGGKPDPRFGAKGWAIVNTGEPTHHMTLARIGPYIYLAGMIGDKYDHEEIVLMRFDRHGHLDKGFGRQGRMVSPISLDAPGQPVQIVPTAAGVLVVLDGGTRPLLTFTKGGKVRREALTSGGTYVSDVEAAVDGGTLILGWRSGDRGYHLARRPLG